jgi:ABC-2 type transport system permease protein
MISLLYKEFKLSINIMAYFMPLLGTLLLIPDWTYFIAFMYAFITIPVTFVICKDQRDHAFSVLLPVRKKDIVKARFISVAIVEMLQIFMAVIFALISNTLHSNGNAWLMDLNVAFFGIVFAIYALFNFVFMTMFYKTAHKILLPVFVSLLIVLVFTALTEYVIQTIPAMKMYFDGLNKERLIQQIPVLIAGILIYISTMIVSYKISYKRFEKIDI